MSKKDYKLIAKAISDVTAHNRITRNTVQAVAVRIAFAMKADNSKFQYSKFLAACGYPVE